MRRRLMHPLRHSKNEPFNLSILIPFESAFTTRGRFQVALENGYRWNSPIMPHIHYRLTKNQLIYGTSTLSLCISTYSFLFHSLSLLVQLVLVSFLSQPSHGALRTPLWTRKASTAWIGSMFKKSVAMWNSRYQIQGPQDLQTDSKEDLDLSQCSDHRFPPLSFWGTTEFWDKSWSSGIWVVVLKLVFKTGKKGHHGMFGSYQR